MATMLLDDRTFAAYPVDSTGTTHPHAGSMTLGGVAIKSLLLLGITCAAGVLGWHFAGRWLDPGYVLWVGSIAGFVLLLALSALLLKYPAIAFFLGMTYAVVQGLYMGVLSKLYNDRYSGIVAQAFLTTLCTFAICVALFNLSYIQDADQSKRILGAAALGAFLLYAVTGLISLAGIDIWFWSAFGVIGTACGLFFSAFLAALAAFFLFADLDVILTGVDRDAPKSMEWYAAFGLLATLIWLYLQALWQLELMRQ